MKSNFSTKSDFFQILGWAFFLASSWTWCIGMFLPVILVRDYGPWGWLVFAVPNIFGACAMAYVLTKPDVSTRIVEKHKVACIVFSLITILFQVYFIGWISRIVPDIFTIIMGLVLFFIGLSINKDQKFAAFIIYLLSLTCFILILTIVPVEKIDLFKSGNLIHNTNALLYLTPICFFGFLLCPYLDLTFHEARQSNTRANSRIAFTIGFCFLFFLMVLFTFFYAGPMATIINGAPYFLKDQSKLPVTYVYIVVFHMLLQSGFTIILHIKSILSTKVKKHKSISLLIANLSILVFILSLIFKTNHTFLDIPINEVIYRSFMAFYSLIAPVYVYLFVIPKNKATISLSKPNLLLWTGVILFALPFYVLGFLGVKWHLEIWLFAGLAIALCSRVLIGHKNINS